MIVNLALIVIVAWLVVLTILFLGVARHLALVDIVQRAVGGERPRVIADADGPPLGSRFSDDVIRLFTEASVELPDNGCLAFIAATCAPCRELAEDLVADRYPYRDVIYVIPGRRDAASEIVAVLRPLEPIAVLNPQAHDLMRMLNINGSPFVVWFRNGQIVSTLFGRSPTDVRLALRQWHEHEVA